MYEVEARGNQNLVRLDPVARPRSAGVEGKRDGWTGHDEPEMAPPTAIAQGLKA